MAKIEKARPEDAEGILEVFYRTWLATYPNEEAGITIHDIEERWKDRAERIEKRRSEIRAADPSQQIFVAHADEIVVGVCRVSKEEKSGHLDAIYVLPEYQGQGIGVELWKSAKEFLGEERDVFVGVATYNKNAVRFYSGLGFVDTGRRFEEERLRMKSGANIPQMEMVLKAT